MSLVQRPVPVWFQVESKTRVAAFPESALRSAGLVGTRALPPPAPCPAGLQPWPPCEYGDCRGRGDLPRAPGHADGETAARGQGDSRPPDGYGYDGAAGSTAPACVVGGSELSQGLGFGSEGLFSLEWPENIRGCSLNPGSEGGPGVPFVQVETARAVTAGPRPSA